MTSSLYIELSGQRGGSRGAESQSWDDVPAELVISALRDLRRKLGRPTDINGREIPPMKPRDTEVGAQIRELFAATGQRLLIDEDCPNCDHYERWFNGTVFGCNECDHTGDYRNQ